MDREYIDIELKKLGLDVFTDHMESIAMDWLNHKPLSKFQQQVFDYMLDSGIYGKDENGIWNKFSEEKQKKKDVSVKQLKKWYFFPPLSYMTEYYPWLERIPVLLPVAWGIRACRGVFMKKGTEKRKMLYNIEKEEIQTYKEIYEEMQLHFK